MTNYVYIRSEPGLYTVGFYDPDGRWRPEGDYDSSVLVAERVHWLNGGKTETEIKAIVLEVLDEVNVAYYSDVIAEREATDD